MSLNAEGSSANIKRSEHPLMSYWINYKLVTWADL